MQNRFVVVASAALGALAAVAGCATPDGTTPRPAGSLPPVTAQVTINGKAIPTTHNIQCTQDGYSHTIETGDEKSGVTFVVDTGNTITAQSVVIRDLGGFTGSVWQTAIGNAQATIIGTTFRVTGTAQGANTDEPNHPATATFEIKANC